MITLPETEARELRLMMAFLRGQIPYALVAAWSRQAATWRWN